MLVVFDVRYIDAAEVLWLDDHHTGAVRLKIPVHFRIAGGTVNHILNVARVAEISTTSQAGSPRQCGIEVVSIVSPWRSGCLCCRLVSALFNGPSWSRQGSAESSRSGYKSAGVRPVCLAIRARIRGPSSSSSWKAKTKSGLSGRESVRCDPD